MVTEATMQYGPPRQGSAEEAEYYFQELRAQQLRAKQLFHGYLGEDAPLDDAEDDDFNYYEDSAR
jgi:hypothetical protein